MFSFLKSKKKTVQSDMVLIAKNVNHVKELVKLKLIRFDKNKILLFRQLWQNSTQKQIENYARNIQLYNVLIRKKDKESPISFVDVENNALLAYYANGKFVIQDETLIRP
jgi:hypothetical protein